MSCNRCRTLVSCFAPNCRNICDRYKMMRNQCSRVRVDLSKFFKDARERSWIFIDDAKKNIHDIQQHIRRTFDINEPFHLLLEGNTYLPLTEDVRIFQEDDIMRVVPGSGVNSSTLGTKFNGVHTSLTEVKTCNNRNIDGTEVVMRDVSDVSHNISSDEIPSIATSNATKDDMTFYTVMEDTEVDADSKIIESTEDCNETALSAPVSLKKKRTRRRKRKDKSQSVALPLDTNEERPLKKPKIVDSVIISSSKHIRFDNTEEEEGISKEAEGEEYNISKKTSKKLPVKLSRSTVSNTNDVTSSKDLSTLLALRGSSTPITFTKKAKKVKSKMERLEEGMECAEDLNATEENDSSMENNLCDEQIDKEMQKHESLKHLDLESMPIMTRSPNVGDVLAFKTLKLDADYTPQISNFLLGKILKFCVETKSYILQILEGIEEIVVPCGKLSVSEDELQNYNKLTLLSTEIREPRLVA